MKLCEKHLQEMIDHIKKEIITEKIKSEPFARAADVGMRLKQDWKETTDKDPEARELLGDLWKNTSVEVSQADPESKDFVGHPKVTDNWPWSAATISTMYADDPEFKGHRTGRAGKGSAAHADYMKAAMDNRKKWIKGEDPSGSPYGYKGFVAFRPKEYMGKKGDIVCTPRGSGDGWNNIGKKNHCDVCLDDACADVVGGNIDDKLTIRSRPKGITMVITKNPEKVSEVRKLSRLELRGVIAEAMFDPFAAKAGAMERLEDEYGEDVVNKINKLHSSDSGEQADELTSSLVGKFYPSESFADDTLQHKLNYVRAHIPDMYSHLTEAQVEAYASLYMQDVRIGYNVNDGIQISLGPDVYGEVLIEGDELQDMIDHLKYPSKFVSSYDEAEAATFKAIIKLSRKTTVTYEIAEQIGIVVYNSSTMDFDTKPEYQNLVNLGKLQIVSNRF